MRLILVFVCIVAAGCATPHVDKAVLPERRPLGKKIKTYESPRNLLNAASAMPKIDKPTGSITLRQALYLALMGNPELASFSWRIRAKEARVLQASLLPNPRFRLVMEDFGGKGERSNFDTTQTSFMFFQKILVAGKRAKRTRLASINRDLAGWDYETKRLDVFTEVSKTFVEVLAAQKRLELKEKLVNLSKETLNTVSERVKAGKVSPVEETRAKVALSSSQIELRQAKRILEGAMKRLVAIWGGQVTFDGAHGQLDAVKPIPSEKQLSNLIAQNPDIARWVVEMEQRMASVELEKANRFPDLTIIPSVRHYSDTGDNAFLFGFVIPLPIFNRNQGKVLEAQSNLIRARQERRSAKMRVRKALASDYQALSTSFIEATILKNDVVPGAQNAFEAVKEGYRYGKFDYLDMLDAQRTLFEVSGRYIEAMANYRKAAADLERLIGTPLEFLKNVVKEEEMKEKNNGK